MPIRFHLKFLQIDCPMLPASFSCCSPQNKGYKPFLSMQFSWRTVKVGISVRLPMTVSGSVVPGDVIYQLSLQWAFRAQLGSRASANTSLHRQITATRNTVSNIV